MLFDTGAAALKPGAAPTIDRLAQFMRDYPERSVRIEGHTDSAGSDLTNQTLSEQRAEAVRRALLERNLEAARITTLGYGEARPIAGNESAGGRQQNRRVEIVVSDEQGVVWRGSASEPVMSDCFSGGPVSPDGSSPPRAMAGPSEPLIDGAAVAGWRCAGSMDRE